MSVTAEKITKLTELTNQLEDSQLIDEFAELHNFLAPHLDKYEKLKKKIQVKVAEDKSDDGVTLTGIKFAIDYSAPAKKLICNVSPRDLVMKVRSWDCVAVSVTAARKSLSEEQIKELFTEKLESRRFKRIRNI